MKTTTMSLVAMFVALMVGSGWALAMIPNIEFVTALAFTAGATLGPLLGMSVGATGMFFFSATNPIGSGLAFPLLLASQVFSMAIVGLAGGLFRPMPTERLNTTMGRIMLAAAGLMLTVIYDGVTSISFPLFAGAPASEIITVLISGLLFTTVHQISNTLIFFLAIPGIITIGRKAYEGNAEGAALLIDDDL